ncbi:hypothetical protein TWF718_001718 [Orbilia javanica]|uniref:F-box domain-containing protein n=1 Tax=Orbilia javanica TaxID=47235 RepID=A0AAN8RSQ1_9PEZI
MVGLKGEQVQASRRLSSIETIPAELLSEIIGFLNQSDMTSLLRASKTLHHGTYLQFWHTFEPSYINGYDLQKLVLITQERGAKTMGFKYIKRLILTMGNIESDEIESGLFSQLFDIFSDMLATGEMKLRHVAFYWDDYKHATPSSRNFLKVLKEYSKANVLSIHADAETSINHNYFHAFPIEAFALERFTYLKVALHGNNTIIEAAKSIEEIELLVRALQRTSHLKELWLDGCRRAIDSEVPISQLPQLEQLQATIMDLKYLQTLTISGWVFHPSFFIVPPENVCKLVLHQTVSISWWRKFSQCPLTGVTHLRQHTSRAGIRFSGRARSWCGDDEEEVSQANNKNYRFILKDLAMQNLRVFESSLLYSKHPENFLELIVQRNKLLRKKYVERCLLQQERLSKARLQSSSFADSE